FRSDSPAIFSLAILTTYGFVAVAAAAYATRLSYERWRSLHLMNGVLFAWAIGISLVQGSPAAFEPLRISIATLGLLGLGSFFHYLVLFRHMEPKFRYRVEATVPRGPDGYDLVLSPDDQRMFYAPGRFVFLAVTERKRWLREIHPFSLSSSPATREVRLSIR